MDYLTYFGLSAEPFSNAPLSRFFYGSRQHADALQRLQWAASSMKGLAILIGDIGLGKTTLARRMLESLPEDQYEAAMLVIVHGGITANWLLKRIAIQLGVPDPADDKLAILSQLYKRLLAIHESGRRAVVIIDEAQMLATRDLMEEFRGLLNLEVPEHKLISFIFFGLPEIERNLRLDPPLAQRIALRYRLRALDRQETAAYIEHRLSFAGGDPDLLGPDAVGAVFEHSRGVPRLVNTLCDNVLLEMFFARQSFAGAELVERVADNLGMTGAAGDALQFDAGDEPLEPVPIEDMLAVEGGPGHDAVVAVERTVGHGGGSATVEPDAIAAQVASEPLGAPAYEPLSVEPGDYEPEAELSVLEPRADEEASLPELVPEPISDHAMPASVESATLPEYTVESVAEAALPELEVIVEDGEGDIEVDLQEVSTVESDAQVEAYGGGDLEVDLQEVSTVESDAEVEAYGGGDLDADVFVDEPLAGAEEHAPLDIEDPLSFLEPEALRDQKPAGPSPWHGLQQGGDIPVESAEAELGANAAAVEVDVAPVAPSRTPSRAPVRERPKPRSIDLSEIDALLADLNLGKKK